MSKPYPRISKIGWMDDFSSLNILAKCSKSSILLIGDSLIAGLSRYDFVWQKYFFRRNTLNCGMGGDRTLNVLWRSQFMALPTGLKSIVIHCGTNDVGTLTPYEIAKNIISIGVTLKSRSPNAFIVITGLLPRDSHFSTKRYKIQEVNDILNESCFDKGFSFVAPDSGWLLNGNFLNKNLYYKDCLHLSEKGNIKFAESIISSITSKPKLDTKLYSEINDSKSIPLKDKDFPPLQITCPPSLLSISTQQRPYSSVLKPFDGVRPLFSSYVCKPPHVVPVCKPPHVVPVFKPPSVVPVCKPLPFVPVCKPSPVVPVGKVPVVPCKLPAVPVCIKPCVVPVCKVPAVHVSIVPVCRRPVSVVPICSKPRNVPVCKIPAVSVCKPRPYVCDFPSNVVKKDVV